MEGARSTSHIVFANDLLLFAEANCKSMKSIAEILLSFSDYSSLMVNPTKSNVIFSLLTPNKEELTGLLRFPISNLPIKHLGMPLGGKFTFQTDMS